MRAESSPLWVQEGVTYCLRVDPEYLRYYSFWENFGTTTLQMMHYLPIGLWHTVNSRLLDCEDWMDCTMLCLVDRYSKIVLKKYIEAYIVEFTPINPHCFWLQYPSSYSGCLLSIYHRLIKPVQHNRWTQIDSCDCNCECWVHFLLHNALHKQHSTDYANSLGMWTGQFTLKLWTEFKLVLCDDVS